MTTLPLGDDSQTPEDYVVQVSATTGLPHVLARRNMQKIRSMLAEMESVLNGLTRNIDWEILDRGFGEVDGHSLSFFPRAQSLGVVLPEQFARSAFVVDSGRAAEDAARAEARQRRAVDSLPNYPGVDSRRRAREAFSFYPADHAGAAEILRSCGRGMIFGDASTTKHVAHRCAH